MISALIDTNVIIDAVRPELPGHAAAARVLAEQSAAGRLLVNEIVYSELAPQVASMTDLDELLDLIDVRIEGFTLMAAYRAGSAHAQYRRTGGVRERTLPDFLIGAHAECAGYRLVTRDARRYRIYFPGLDIVVPGDDPKPQ